MVHLKKVLSPLIQSVCVIAHELTLPLDLVALTRDFGMECFKAIFIATRIGNDYANSALLLYSQVLHDSRVSTN